LNSSDGDILLEVRAQKMPYLTNVEENELKRLKTTTDEHSKQARAPHTNGPRDVPRCEALNLLQKLLHYKGGSAEIVPSFCACGPWPSCYPRPRFIRKVLDRGIQAVLRSGARCALHVLGRSAKADPCGRSFAVLSTQTSTVGLRLSGAW
jgi:hypothetical protein